MMPLYGTNLIHNNKKNVLLLCVFQIRGKKYYMQEDRLKCWVLPAGCQLTVNWSAGLKYLTINLLNVFLANIWHVCGPSNEAVVISAEISSISFSHLTSLWTAKRASVARKKIRWDETCSPCLRGPRLPSDPSGWKEKTANEAIEIEVEAEVESVTFKCLQSFL